MVKILSDAQVRVSNVANRVATSVKTQLNTSAKKIASFVNAILSAISNAATSVKNSLSLAGRKVLVLASRTPAAKIEAPKVEEPKVEVAVEAPKVEETIVPVVVAPRHPSSEDETVAPVRTAEEEATLRNLAEGFGVERTPVSVSKALNSAIANPHVKAALIAAVMFGASKTILGDIAIIGMSVGVEKAVNGFNNILARVKV